MNAEMHRRDIDVLRAIAVLCVVVFHLDPGLLPGGYVGVDVFFVISGFLITGGILARDETGRFSFRDFYLRRFRRLFPAALVTIAATFAAGATWLSPEHLTGLSASAASAVFSLSNFYFWRHQGYFDLDAEFSPLLHTWSLGVEEQFYLAWPLLLLGIGAVRRRPRVALWAVVVSSTLAAEVQLQFDAAAAYYLMPFRAGEFAIGALCCAPLRDRRVQAFCTRRAGWVHALGLGLVAGSALLMDGESRFPGVAALLPCAGAAAMLLAGEHRSGAFACTALLAWIGRMSYSLYLVHWPIVEFWRYHGLATDGGRGLAMLAGLILLAGIALHYGVERPFRAPASGKPRISSGAALAASASMALLLCVATLGAWRSEGWPSRVPQAIAGAIEHSRAARKLAVSATRATCSLDEAAQPIGWWAQCLRETSGASPGYLIIGDSHGRDTREALRLAYPGENLPMLYQSRCLPFEYERGARAPCFVGMAEFLERELPRLPVRGVILTSHFGTAQDGRVADTIRALRRAHLPVLVFGPTMAFAQPVPAVAIQHGRLAGLDQRVNALQNARLYASDAALATLAAQEGAAFVSKLDALCPRRECLVAHPGRGALVAFDDAHWTPETHAYVAARWRERWPTLAAMFASGGSVESRAAR